MSNKSKKEKTNILPYILIGVPLLFVAGIAAFQLLYSGNERDSFDLTDNDDNLRVFEQWQDKSAKSKVHEWPEGKDSFVKFCYYDISGKHLGCGIEKNGKMWEGARVEWYRYSKRNPTEQEGYGVAQRIFEYSNGKADGLWKTYYSNGAINSETIYENGQRLSTVVYDPAGMVIDNMAGSKAGNNKLKGNSSGQKN